MLCNHLFCYSVYFLKVFSLFPTTGTISSVFSMNECVIHANANVLKDSDISSVMRTFLPFPLATRPWNSGVMS